MPLIRPEIQQVLRSAGLLPSSEEKSASDKLSLSEKMDAAGLSLENTLERFADLVQNTTNESLRAKCLETSLRAHGALKETAAAPPSFTIVIQNSSPELPNGVNPILLPRQLLNSIATKEKEN